MALSATGESVGPATGFMLKSSLAIVLLMMAVAGAFAQVPDDGTKFIRVFAEDNYGRSFTGLKAENFEVREGGDLQTITSFTVEDRGFSVAFLIDGNYFPVLSSVLALQMIQNLDAGNRYSVIGYGKTRESLASWDASDAELAQAFSAAADRDPHGSSSAFNDAVVFALEKLRSAPTAKKILVVFSDGLDRVSKTNTARLAAAARDTDATIVGVAFISDRDWMRFNSSPHEALDKLVSKTGGRVFDIYYPAAGPGYSVDVFRDYEGRTIRREVRGGLSVGRTDFEKQVGEYAERIAGVIANSWLIGYVPKRPGRETKVALRVRDANGKKLLFKLSTKELAGR